MSKWRFRYYGDPVLRKKCEPIEEITDEIKKLAEFMIHYADNNNGIGIAAPQMGIPIRLFVLRDYIISSDGQWSVSTTPKVFINPKIIWKNEETEVDNEGCMSFPGLFVGPIERPSKIKIEATDIDGNNDTLTVTVNVLPDVGQQSAAMSAAAVDEVMTDVF